MLFQKSKVIFSSKLCYVLVYFVKGKSHSPVFLYKFEFRDACGSSPINGRTTLIARIPPSQKMNMRTRPLRWLMYTLLKHVE